LFVVWVQIARVTARHPRQGAEGAGRAWAGDQSPRGGQ